MRGRSHFFVRDLMLGEISWGESSQMTLFLLAAAIQTVAGLHILSASGPSSGFEYCGPGHQTRASRAARPRGTRDLLIPLRGMPGSDDPGHTRPQSGCRANWQQTLLS